MPAGMTAHVLDLFGARARRAAAAAALLGCACFGLGAPLSGDARDDAPEEIARQESPVSLPEERVRYFARQFKAKCARCHGIEGDGGGAEAQDQPVPPRDFTDPAYMRTRSDGQLFWQILKGGGDRCAMPAFGPGSDHAWGEEKVWLMVEYVRRFERESADDGD